MAETYGNALFTVAASHASKPSEGVFPTNNRLVYTPCLLPLPGYTARNGEPYRIHLSSRSNDTPIGKAPPKGPLYNRAWVLGEQMLSRVTLAFTEQDMHWLCLESEVTESDPQGESDIYRDTPLRDAIMTSRSGNSNDTTDENDKKSKFPLIELFDEADPTKYKKLSEDELIKALSLHSHDLSKYLPQKLPKQPLPKEKSDGIYKDWSEIVGDFSRRAITYPSDRLPALSGVAQGMKVVLSSSRSMEMYVGGIWTHDLDRGLLWRVGGDNRRPRDRYRFRRFGPPEWYVAPSWSWASMRGAPITWASTYWSDMTIGWLRMVQCPCDIDGFNAFGNLAGAELVLEGYGRKVCEVRGEELLDRKGERVGRWEMDEEGEGRVGEEVFCMPVSSEKDDGAAESNGWKIKCLALVSTGLKAFEYRRIGIAQIDDSEWFRGKRRKKFTLV